jgi:hypothetical protein
MKRTWLYVAILAIAFEGCKSKSKTGNATVYFNNVVNGQALNVGADPNHLNALGQKFSVNKLKYYVNNVRLKDDKGNVVSMPSYVLINESLFGAKRTISLPNIANGKYVSLQFNLGVDAVKNNSGAQDGDLDPIYGMYWSWTGYIFLSHEGSFIDNTATLKGLTYHYGDDKNYIQDVTIPLTNCVVDGNDKEIKINFDVAKLYDGIDFNMYNIVMTDDPNDAAALTIVRNNIRNSFTFNSVK